MAVECISADDVPESRGIIGTMLLEDELSKNKPIVILVEDDASVLRALARLMESAGFEVRAFDCPSSLRAADMPTQNACLVLDVHLPEMSGVALYRKLAGAGSRLPLILITAHIDPAADALIESVDPIAVLRKPFSRESLLVALREAFASARNS
jgi:FixJ family two-component response regulator